jgi:hypothetical protein
MTPIKSDRGNKAVTVESQQNQQRIFSGVTGFQGLLPLKTNKSNALIKKEPNNLYLVCIIPDFFGPLGFFETVKFPASIQDKIDYCSNELVVPENYVAMKFNND